MRSPYTAEAMYAAAPVAEATASAIADHAAAGRPEPNRQVTGRTPGLGNPVVVLLVLAGIAFALINVDLRFSGSVSA